MQDTEEYLEATKAVRSTDSAPERSKRPTRRAAVIARENVNFLAGNVQNGIELRESRKANERAQVAFILLYHSKTLFKRSFSKKNLRIRF